MPWLFEAEAEKVQQQHEQQGQELYAEIGRLTAELTLVSKKIWSQPCCRVERRALVDREQPDLSLKRQAELLSVSRASLYYQPVLPSAEENTIKHRIDEILHGLSVLWLAQNPGPIEAGLGHQLQADPTLYA